MSRIFALSTFMFTVIAAAPLTAAATPCKSFSPDKLLAITSKVCEKVDGGTRFECNSGKIDAAGDTFKEWVREINELAGNGPLKIGARTLGWGITEHGRIIAPGDRMWVSDVPAAGGASVTVDYEEGKAEVIVYYCALDAAGNATILDKQRVRGKSPKRRTFSAAQLEGKFLAVHLDGRKPLTRAYAYGIHIHPIGARPRLSR